MRMTLTLMVLILGLVACGSTRETRSQPHATLPSGTSHSPSSSSSAAADRSATDFDQKGYEAFKAKGVTTADVSAELFQSYAGRFPEERALVKVDGRLEIQPTQRRLVLRMGCNRARKEMLCSIDVNARIETVSRTQFGYMAWIKESSLKPETRTCLESRFEPTDIVRTQGRFGLALDYYNANVLRVSLKDGYIFFVRER